MFVKDIRESDEKITNQPIIYYWWFKVSVLKILLEDNQLDYDFLKLKIKELNSQNYALLYIGKAKKGNERLVDYHILDKGNFHKEKTVLNGRLSSLRQTLCGLLHLNMISAKQNINEFMDKNCFVEWSEVIDDDLSNCERAILQKNYLPLNCHHQTHNFEKNYRRILSSLKKQFKN